MIDRAPQMVGLAVDPHEHLIKVPAPVAEAPHVDDTALAHFARESGRSDSARTGWSRGSDRSLKCWRQCDHSLVCLSARRLRITHGCSATAASSEKRNPFLIAVPIPILVTDRVMNGS